MSRPVGVLTALAVLVAFAVPASAAAVTNVPVQGTTDVRDAGLLTDVIEPGFEAAYPQYNLIYTAVGTGQALTNARSGQGDAVLTHAAPLEASFVSDGYSDETYGRAIFYSDYVILGPPNDPAGVMTGAPHNAAHAFELIAAAGTAGTANFVSRGDLSGTNVTEQQIWNKTTGVTVCAAATGRSEPSTTSGACPTTATPPAWYHRAGLGQAQAVQLAEQCPFTGGGCYEMTDRGTYNRLVSTGAISQLKVVADKNTADAPGGKDLLVNSFHAYVVNPDKFAPGVINAEAGKAFVDYLTSKDFQRRLASYPDTSNPAFFASAAPEISSSNFPATVMAGTKVDLAGKVANAVPGTPPLDNVLVSLKRSDNLLASAVPLPTAQTGADGGYSLSFTPDRSGLYSLETPSLTRIVIPGTQGPPPTPPFGDLLQDGSAVLGNLTVQASVQLDKVKVTKQKVIVSGTALPGTSRSAPELVLLTKRTSGKKKKELRPFDSHTLASSGADFSETFKMKRPGKYKVAVRYVDSGVVEDGQSSAQTITIEKKKRK